MAFKDKRRHLFMEKQSMRLDLLYLICQQHLEGNHFILPENLKHPCLVLHDFSIQHYREIFML